MSKSKFVKVKDKWQHEDSGGIYFDKKPPEWIVPYLVCISERSYSRGRQHAIAPLKEIIEDILES